MKNKAFGLLELERTTINLLSETLAAFGVQAFPIDKHEGCTVTRYTFTMIPGTKISKVTGLSREICAALGVDGVNIITPLHGVPLGLAIDVPASERRPLYLNKLNTGGLTGELPFYVGEKLNGELLQFDLTDAPHMIVAGATQSGKSVFLNNVIKTLCKIKSPHQLQLHLVDMKRVELRTYEAYPHTLCYCSEQGRVLPLLTALIRTMEARYCMFDLASVVCGKPVPDIKTYNQLPAQTQIETYRKCCELYSAQFALDASLKVTKIARTVTVIDEVADLLTGEYKKPVETLLARLTAKCRAAGMHIILATQHPSAKVLTTDVKANMPARIAFTTANGIASKAILDVSGAENLTGKGDALFTAPCLGVHPIRVQTPFC